MIRVAVTYDGQGNVFQHFGQTRQFKVYNINDGKVVDSLILESGPYSHGSLATLLKENSVSVLICGGIGGGAIQMLGQIGIKVYPGTSGDTDVAVQGLIDGNLVRSSESTCDHIHDCKCNH